MKRAGAHRGGYTIVETMIYLAVTSILFVSAAILISGQQAKTEYNQAVREVESFIADINNDISTGYYPAIEQNKKCVEGDDGKPELVEEADDVGRGTSGECLFLGRLLHVVPQDSSEQTKEQTINVHTIVGLRLDDGEESKTFADAKARAFSNQLVETRQFSSALSFKWIRQNDTEQTTAFGFVSELQPSLAVDGFGSAVASLVTVGDLEGITHVGDLPSSTFDSFTAADRDFVNPDKIELCVESNSITAYSIITIDQAGGISTVTNRGSGCPTL